MREVLNSLIYLARLPHTRLASYRDKLYVGIPMDVVLRSMKFISAGNGRHRKQVTVGDIDLQDVICRKEKT